MRLEQLLLSQSDKDFVTVSSLRHEHRAEHLGLRPRSLRPQALSAIWLFTKTTFQRPVQISDVRFPLFGQVGFLCPLIELAELFLGLDSDFCPLGFVNPSFYKVHVALEPQNCIKEYIP
jgi:hypothetical protein